MEPDHRRARWTRRQLIVAAGSLAGVVAVPSILGSCGGGGSGSTGSDAPTGTAVQETPAAGGTLRVALTGEPPSMDLHRTTDAIVLLVASHIFETLFTWDSAHRPAPLLAETHETSSDGLRHRLALRSGVRFHNGEVLTAEDVIASIRRWAGLSGLGMGFIGSVEDIAALDANTIEFKMKEPFGAFETALARQLQGCAIYPRSVLKRSTGTEPAELIGTGPYRFVDWSPDQQILLERYDDYVPADGAVDGYAGAKARYLDSMQFIPVRNEASRIAGVQAGDYHFVETVSPDQAPVLRAAQGVVVDTQPADSWLNIVLNLRSPALQDLRMRRAIQLTLDHEAIMLAAFGEGFYELSPELVPGAVSWYSEAGAEYFNQNRPDEAERLLDEIDYDGRPLRIMVTQEIQHEYNATLTMNQQLQNAGFVTDLQLFDGATLSDRRNDETAWDLYAAWASFRPDPIMRNLTAAATGWWENEEKEELLAQLLSESDHDRRFEKWERIQQLFYEDVPRLKIGNSRRVLVHSSDLHDVGPTEMQPEFANAWLEK